MEVSPTTPRLVAVDQYDVDGVHPTSKTVDGHVGVTVNWFIELIQGVHAKLRSLVSALEDPDLMEVEKQLGRILVQMTSFSTELENAAMRMGIVIKEEPDPNWPDPEVLSHKVQTPSVMEDQKLGILADAAYPCDRCPKSFPKPQYLALHKRKAHVAASRKKHPCLVCGRKFSSTKALSRHVFATHSPKSHEDVKAAGEVDNSRVPSIGQLPLVIHAVDSSDALEQGSRNSADNSVSPVSVQEASDSKNSLVPQKLRTPKKLLCPDCGKQFRFEKSLRNHQTAAHGALKFSCETCGKEFSSKMYLVKHTKEVHDGQRARHLCTICGKKVFILKSHMESVHLGVKYPCERCGKEFATPPGLKVHILTFHEGNKYPCDLCGKVFGHKGYLKSHVDMVHKGKKYPCNVCGREFNDTRSRRQHAESAHQGKKHTCNLCNKDFSRHDHLMRHRQSVHEGRRFPCNICGKEFSQSGDLKRHCDTVHQEQTRPNPSNAPLKTLLPAQLPPPPPLTAAPTTQQSQDILAAAAAAVTDDFLMLNSFLHQQQQLDLQHHESILHQPKIEVTSNVDVANAFPSIVLTHVS